MEPQSMYSVCNDRNPQKMRGYSQAQYGDAIPFIGTMYLGQVIYVLCPYYGGYK
jgi:hypothetical protein